MDFTYYPTAWDWLMMMLVGLIVVMLALVALALLAVRRGEALAARSQSLAGGLAIGLATGLLCGIVFLVMQSYIGAGFLLAPGQILPGLRLGLGAGALVALAVGAFVAFRSAPVVGLMLGAAIALALFRIVFGATAGFGGEVGLGVGREVGVMFGAAGGLLGGIVGHAFRPTARRQPNHAGLRWSWPLIGLALGALGGALAGGLGVFMGLFQFLVPYNGQIPDVPPDTSPAGMLHDLLFGLGMFAVGGALIGCFLTLQWLASHASDRTGARRHGVWLGAGLVIALIGGLSFGLNQTGVGGPAPLLGVPHIPYDPAAGAGGLLLGLVAGGAVGALLLLAARAHPRWRLAVGQVVALVTGALLMALPYWYIPVVGFSMR